MMAYTGGDAVGAVVAEVGRYSTKMGYAGEDFPRSLFRSEVAVKRGGDGGGDDRRIASVSHDCVSRPLNPDGTDSGWDKVNPIEQSTGLLFSPHASSSSSHNSNDDGDAGGGGGDEKKKKSADKGRRGKNETKAAAPVSPEEERDGECYDLFRRHLNHGYDSALRTSPSDHPFLLVERSYDPPPIRQHLLEILFDDLGVPAAFLGRDATMACYAVGRTTGTVVDVGHGGTTVTPVFEGYVETRGIMRSPVGGSMMDEYVLETLDRSYKKKMSRRAGGSKMDSVVPRYQLARGSKALHRKRRSEPWHHHARASVARECREDGSGWAVATFGYDPSSTEESKGGGGAVGAPKMSFELPDGTKVDVPHGRRYGAAELLFGSDDESVRWREDGTTKAKKALAEVISAAASASSSSGGGGDDGGNGSDGGVGAVSGLPTKRIRGRRPAGGAKGGAAARGGRKPYSHRSLNAASASHLNNHLGDLTSSPIPSLVCDAAFKCDRDQQAQLLGNVVVCGGGACVGPSNDSFPDRLREEVEAIVHTHTPGWRVKVLSPGMGERRVQSWLGASILGSLGTFHEMWITRAEYEEFGPAIVNRKCP